MVRTNFAKVYPDIQSRCDQITTRAVSGAYQRYTNVMQMQANYYSKQRMIQPYILNAP